MSFLSRKRHERGRWLGAEKKRRQTPKLPRGTLIALEYRAPDLRPGRLPLKDAPKLLDQLRTILSGAVEGDRDLDVMLLSGSSVLGAIPHDVHQPLDDREPMADWARHSLIGLDALLAKPTARGDDAVEEWRRLLTATRPSWQLRIHAPAVPGRRPTRVTQQTIAAMRRPPRDRLVSRSVELSGMITSWSESPHRIHILTTEGVSIPAHWPEQHREVVGEAIKRGAQVFVAGLGQFRGDAGHPDEIKVVRMELGAPVHPDSTGRVRRSPKDRLGDIIGTWQGDREMSVDEIRRRARRLGDTDAP